MATKHPHQAAMKKAAEHHKKAAEHHEKAHKELIIAIGAVKKAPVAAKKTAGKK